MNPHYYALRLLFSDRSVLLRTDFSIVGDTLEPGDVIETPDYWTLDNELLGALEFVVKEDCGTVTEDGVQVRVLKVEGTSPKKEPNMSKYRVWDKDGALHLDRMYGSKRAIGILSRRDTDGDWAYLTSDECREVAEYLLKRADEWDEDHMPEPKFRAGDIVQNINGTVAKVIGVSRHVGCWHVDQPSEDGDGEISWLEKNMTRLVPLVAIEE